jgi:hypothetical protein
MKRILTLIALCPAVLLAAQSDQTDSFIGPLLVMVLLAGAFALGVWGRIFVRAGYPRWHSLVMMLPLFNLFVAARMIREAGYSLWWMLLLFVPLGALVGSFVLAYAEEWPAERDKREAAAAAAAAWKNCPTSTHANLQDWLNQSQRKG